MPDRSTSLSRGARVEEGRVTLSTSTRSRLRKIWHPSRAFPHWHRRISTDPSDTARQRRPTRGKVHACPIDAMSAAKTFLMRHPVVTYFVLTFVISWSGILVVLGPGAFTGATTPADGLLPLVFLAMFAGPTVAGILMTGLVDGNAGYHDLRSRLLRWRLGLRWYAIALLAAPLVVTAVLLALSFSFAGFLPGVFTADDKVSLVVIGLAAGLMTGFCEELGWTGFVIPRLRLRYGIPTTGLIVGLLWGAWHFPLFSGGDLSGALPLALFLPVQLFSFLPAYRVLMVWVYDRTGSLLVAMLMHASLTASTLILQPLDVTGMRAVTYDLILTAALWLLIAALAMANGRQLSHHRSGRGWNEGSCATGAPPGSRASEAIGVNGGSTAGTWGGGRTDGHN
jgi:membrane protease YdiL (CAAX protease family)